MALMIPALSKTRRDARRLCCATQMQQIGIAVFTYAQNHDHHLITAGEILYSTPSEMLSAWFIRLLPYIGRKPNESDILKNTAPIWICPEDKDAYPRGYLNCPHNPMVTYAPNGYHPQKNAPNVPADIRLGPAGGYTLEQLKHPSECFLMGETSYAAMFYDADAPSVAAYNLPRDGHYRGTSGFYHSGTMNLLFSDGHIANIRGKKTPDLVWPAGCELPYQQGKYMYWPDLALPSAAQDPAFWGPGY
jgi:prepilin-type processing-associated H-X9-DG protein